ncbi:MAG: PD-(D/E)XK nuclease domain-containing protein, partial [Myxococcota bacterium]
LRPSDSLSDTAQQALRQIQDKTYHAEMLNRGVEQVIALGLAFRGKEAVVKHKVLTAAGT